MSSQAPSKSWPTHWYSEGNPYITNFSITCLADDCDFIFDENNLESMKEHWNQVRRKPSPADRSLNDHLILYAIVHQKECVHRVEGELCDFEADGNVQELLDHEQKSHGRTDMSRIGKYLALVRHGLRTFPNAAYEKFAFMRLVSKIGDHPNLRDAILEYGSPNTSSSMRAEDRIIAFLEQHNRESGRQTYAVIPQQAFLAHRAPQPEHDGTDWPQAWEQLRSMYRQGQI